MTHQEQLTQQRVLAFDIGVKNLAFALVSDDCTVHLLENISLLPDVEPIRCQTPVCAHLAKYRTPTSAHCKRHLPKTHTILAELDKKKPPLHRRLKELIKEHGCEAAVKGMSSAAALAALHTRFALPVQQPKGEAVARLSLETLHDALRVFVESRRLEFQTATHVLLENQPAFKNPHMKSVQVLLFATLREAYYRWNSPVAHPVPPFHLVHAKKKVEDAPKGDAGYAERKQKSETRLRELFESQQVKGPTWYDAWKKAKKKSDMADALCMSWDFLQGA
jgi:hypothetical protein